MSEEIDPKSGLTPLEHKAMAQLVEFWNTACETDMEPADKMQLVVLVNQIQCMFAQRAAARAFPEFWGE